MSLHKDQKTLITKSAILVTSFFVIAIALRIIIYFALKGTF